MAMKSARGLVEAESTVLPRCALTESSSAPARIPRTDRGFSSVRLRQRVGLCGLLPRHVESRSDRFEDILARSGRAPEW